MTQDDTALNNQPAQPGPVALGVGKTLDLLLPPQCLSCGCIVPELGTLCADCWNGMSFLAAPCCRTCGLPFPDDPGPDAQCGACLRHPPPFERARAVMVYDAASRGMMLAFKHADRTDMAPAFAEWMARAGGELIDAADVIVPVPLHWTRLLSRQYNQAAMLARALARRTDLPFLPRGLARRRRTPSQAGMNFSRRVRNVRGAFAVPPGGRAKIAGKRVLLIDDVFTTGATIGACARTLVRAGASAVDVLTLTRVVRADGDIGV